jgi:hypothetical protein
MQSNPKGIKKKTTPSSVPLHSAAFRAQDKTIPNSIFVNSTTFSFHTIFVSIPFFLNKAMISKFHGPILNIFRLDI